MKLLITATALLFSVSTFASSTKTVSNHADSCSEVAQKLVGRESKILGHLLGISSCQFTTSAGYSCEVKSQGDVLCGSPAGKYLEFEIYEGADFRSGSFFINDFGSVSEN